MNSSDNNFAFLTGSTGLLGAHLLIHLKCKGKRIRCLIRSTSSMKQIEQVCSFYGESFEKLKSSVDWVVGDTLDYVHLKECMKGASEVYHCAAVVSFNSKDRQAMLKINVQGTANMVDAALSNKVEKFCFISSIASLGKTLDYSPVLENTPRKTDEKVSAYSESKFKSELQVWRGIAEGLNAVILNPGVILGSGMLEKGSMLIVKNGIKGIPFYTKATTGYVDVRDVCAGAIQLMEKELFGQRFIFVSENAHNGQIFGMLARNFGKKPPRYEVGPAALRIGVFVSSFLSIFSGKTSQLTNDTVQSAQHPVTYSNEKIREALDFEFIPLEQTINEVCSFIKSLK
jgi:dihydroflavonol-4-reductase